MKKLLLGGLCLLMLLTGCSSKPAGQGGSKDVTIKIGADFLEGMETDAASFVESVKAESSSDFKEIKANDDGTVTLVMDAAKNKEYLDEMKKEIDSSITELTSGEAAAYITKITYNDNMTSFDMTMVNTSVSIMESMASVGLFMFGAMYQMFAGVAEDKIDVQVNYIGPDGKVIDSAKLSDAGKE